VRIRKITVFVGDGKIANIEVTGRGQTYGDNSIGIRWIMRETYKWATLGLGTIITVAVSLACSYWFFYSLMGSTGYQAIGAGIAGCAIQLFGYGFAARFLPIKMPVRVFLCFVPLALSMLSSYSALYGYLSKEKITESLAAQEQQLIVNILEQSARDKEIASSAAQQGVADAYRTQAKGFLQLNDVSRDKDERLLGKLEQHKEENKTASPLDGLVKVTGDSELTTIIFCAWLAIMFDILPVIAISVFSRRKEEATRPALVIQQQKKQMVEREEHLIHEDSVSSNSEYQYEVPEQPTYPQKDSSESSDKNVVYEEVIVKMRKNDIKPNYKSVREYTGWTQWKAQEFFKYCQESGILEKQGRRFRVINNISTIENIRQLANA